MKLSAIGLALALAVPTLAFASADQTDTQAPQKVHGVHQPGGPGHKHEGRKPGGPEGGGPGGPGHFIKKVAKDLDLTDEQVKVFQKTGAEEMADHFAITKRYLDKLPAEEQLAMKTEHEAALERRKNEFIQSLTPAQKAKAEAFFKQQKERFDKHKADREKAKG